MNKVLLLLAIVVLAGMGCATATEHTAQSSEDNRLYSLSFQDYDGNDVSLADFEGKHLVINSWASWC